MIVNVWRPLQPVRNYGLAVLDGRTLQHSDLGKHPTFIRRFDSTPGGRTMGRVGGGGGRGHDDPGREATSDGGGDDGRGRGVVDLAGRPVAVREGEVMTPLHDPAHEWYYYPDMTPNEALVLKIFDSRLDGGGGGGERSEGSEEGGEISSD